MKKLVWIILSAMGFSLHAQNFVPGKPAENGMSAERLGRVDNMINDLISKKRIPGAVVFVARNGKVVYHKAYGYSDAEKQTAMKKDDIFRIASQSKAITSLAVMMLYEEGLFTLDEPISKYIPEFKNPKVLVNLNWRDTTYTTAPAKSEITIRQLLTHTSGIDYAQIGNQEFRAIYAKAGVPSGIGNDNMVLADKMKILGGLPLKFHPGEGYQYGLNIDVLGYLVEVLSGKSLDEFFRTRIFQPLGMNDTYFYLPKEKHGRLVGLYQSMPPAPMVRLKQSINDAVNPDYPTVAGKYYSGGAGLSSSIEDYAKFLQMFLNKGEYNGVRLLSRKTIEMIMTNQTPPTMNEQMGLCFGLETEKNDFRSPASIGSFSWGGAFNTQYWADPKEKIVALIYTNMYNSPGLNTGDRFKSLVYQAVID